MKKVLFIVGMVFLFQKNASATYSRVTSNGGLFGYDYTNKQTDYYGNVSIECKNSGFSWCPSILPNNSENENNLINKIVSMVDQGVFKGKIIENGLIGVWESSDKNMTTSKILINKF